MNFGRLDSLDASEKELMAQRAQELAEVPKVDRRGDLLLRVSVVSVGDERFGLPVDNLCEIMVCPNITPLPSLPSWMLGLAKTRDRVITVVDLGRLFGVSGAPTKPPYLAIVSGRPGRLALGVGGGGRFVDIFSEDIAHDLSGQAHEGGLPIFATTHDLITLLDPARFFAMPTIFIGESDETTRHSL